MQHVIPAFIRPTISWSLIHSTLVARPSNSSISIASMTARISCSSVTMYSGSRHPRCNIIGIAFRFSVTVFSLSSHGSAAHVVVTAQATGA